MKIRNSILILTISIVAVLDTTASNLADIAAVIKPGNFRPLNTISPFDVWRFGVQNEPLFCFSNGGSWDPFAGRMLYCGAPHGNSMRFAAYEEVTNTWKIYPMPAGVDWAGAHSYDHQTIDSSGIFYNLYWSDGVAYCFDTKTNKWISPLPATNTGFGTLDYFPEANGLLRVVGGKVTFFSLKTRKWTTLTNVTMGYPHNIAQYCASGKFIYFGGGDNNNNFYIIDSTLRIKAVKQPPFPMSVTTAHLTQDPVSGTLLALRQDSLYAYDISSDSWNSIAKNPVSTQEISHMAMIPINTYGVVALLSTSQWPVLLYKYRAPVSVESKRVKQLAVNLRANHNPFREQVTLSLPSGTTDISIFDLNGKHLFHQNTTGKSDIVWNATKYPAGVYIVKTRGLGTFQTLKLTLQ
ncbi:MAG: T9SS type A sorting domain-containing protein [Fibrobacteres bacterium]|nr:T9SS type A sorting domain-containing protein [Fibrobacterota bacterium]